MPRFRVLIILCAILVFRPLSATTIDLSTWEELVLGCDLVGVVRCVTAGGMIATYQVEEVWKGNLLPVRRST